MYASNVAQYLFTEYETGQGVGAEYIKNPAKDLDKYGAYLEALYNDERLICGKSNDSNTLSITFNPKT